MPDIESTLRDAAVDLPLPSEEATDRALRRALERPVPATRPHRRTFRVSARLVIAAAAVLVLGGGIAVAFGGRIADLISSDPSPSSIDRSFQRALNPQGIHARGVQPQRPIRSTERLVIKHPSRWGGDLHIYEARTTLGETCYLLTRTRALGVTCAQHAAAKPGKPIELISTFEGPPTSKVIHSELAGRPYSARAVAVRVRFQGGGSARMALTSGWFFYEPSRAHGMDGPAQVVAIDVLDASGATIDTQAIHLNSSRSCRPSRSFRSAARSVCCSARRSRTMVG